MVRCWNFVLPETGEHSFRIENIGTCAQRVFLDGQEMESRPGQETFAGPDGALLRIKQCADPCKTPRSVSKEAKWTLLVNERLVEEVNPRGGSLRDLRSMGEGSYTIAIGFDAEGVVQNACRKYKFFVDDEPHEVTVAHRECVWQVALDGQLMDQESHSLNDNYGTAEFRVINSNGAQVHARLEMTWVLMELKWAYRLAVGGVNVPVAWTKAKGDAVGATPPKIFATTPGTQAPVNEEPQSNGCAPASDPTQDVAPDSLPQGVSYDRETKSFQANIKDVKSKRYVFLGEFASVDAAHQKYLEALSRYSPDKQLAPALPA
eukprot:gnl/MRDRNA2_/MRDRNA2_54419_c0_seq1.p1 gnl/MRDRNA2_/MRDRNA2_54419_c0~~gnl/MRDRNA2_/MRDRNA2_54419_c0_seq1.p1  ORF type:complete len:319 (-),score=66.79 gnl/MRDRNA2_/MRDRNA2_54419_c0_seq1:121-1077(-)